MARCHRIGQKKQVTIYRLITRRYVLTKQVSSIYHILKYTISPLRARLRSHFRLLSFLDSILPLNDRLLHLHIYCIVIHYRSHISILSPRGLTMSPLLTPLTHPSLLSRHHLFAPFRFPSSLPLSLIPSFMYTFLPSFLPSSLPSFVPSFVPYLHLILFRLLY